MKKLYMKRSTVSLGVAIALTTSSTTAFATGGWFDKFRPNYQKYLIAWMGDQMLDGNNCRPLDNVHALRGAEGTFDNTVDCQGVLPDADFIGVIDADPRSSTYGQVVNTAEMPAVYGAHQLSNTDDFVDEALDLST